ncbi:MAG: T9SS type A sorting domain-containing protein [Bacteroidetes bacterium]|nr:T9SS type A sorting domain-containing protein [Bacteroidota bacterium]MCW5896670.1 T9SS type A sorting domain-containing protein [Bacteroidota bacterium]
MICKIQTYTFLFFLIPCVANAWQLSFPQDTIAYNDKFNNRQGIAFDSEGTIHVVYSGQIGTNSATREIYYVTDSANTLVTKHVTANLVDDNYPTITLDKYDNVHVGYLGRDAGTLFQVQYSRLDGDTFTTPVFITSAGLNKATPMCAIGPDSVLHFVYHTFPQSGTQHAYYRRYDLRDLSLSPEQLLFEASITGDFDSGIAVDTAGFVHIVTKTGSAFGGPLKYYTNRTGTLVETPTGVAVDVDYPRILVSKDNVVHILYRNSPTEVLQVVNNASGSFGSPVPVSAPGQRPAGYHNFASDDEGRIFVVYQSSVAASGRGWYLVHGKNGAFSDTLQVADLPPGYVTRNTSAIAARGNGEIAVTYSPGAVRNSVVVCDIFMKRGTIQTTIVREEGGQPVSFALHQNYPNPFNPTTTIKFSLPSSGSMLHGTSLRVYDVLGREVTTLVNENLQAGNYEVTFDAAGLASGVYIYRLQAGEFSTSARMILMR